MERQYFITEAQKFLSKEKLRKIIKKIKGWQGSEK
jgi:hypothetical protein